MRSVAHRSLGRPAGDVRHRCTGWDAGRNTGDYNQSVVQVPDGLQARVLFRLNCENGHSWGAYGPDEQTHWGPALCPHCVGVVMSATRLTDLTGNPSHRFRFRKRAHVPGHPEAVFEIDVDADRWSKAGGTLRFLTADRLVVDFSLVDVIGQPEERQ